MKSSLIAPLAIISFLIVLNSEAADQVSIAGSSIILPAPERYYRIDGKSPKWDAFSRTRLAPSNRLLAEYASEHDLADILKGDYPELKRSCNAQSIRALEGITISSSMFEELKGTVRSDLQQAIEKAKPMIRKLEEQVGGFVSKDSGLKTDLKIGEIIPLGVFAEDSRSISFSALTKIRLATEEIGKPIEIVAIVAASTIHVNDRSVNLSCTSIYETKEDIRWTRERLMKWKEAVLFANDNSSHNASIFSKPAGGRQANEGHSDLDYTNIWGRALGKGLGVALLLGLIYVIRIFIALFKEK